MVALGNWNLQSEQRRLLDRLGDGKYGAQGNMIENVTCLPGTRVEILERIDSWIRSTSNPKRVLWIRGMAGRGKSTIASTVALNWKHRATCAIFHFRRGQNILDSRLVCSLARQLGKSVDPEIRNAILSSVQENEDIGEQRLDEQFQGLFVTPLSNVGTKAFPVLIIVDALDECESVDYAVDFIKLINLKSSLLPDNVKFLLTSRPEPPLLRVLEPMEWETESLDSGDDIDADIEQYLRHGLLTIVKDRRIQQDWPPPGAVAELVQMSQGLFQWARTVVRYISEGSPNTRLAEVLKAPKMWGGMDELYAQILSKALKKVDASTSKRSLLLSLLGTLVAATHPVSLEVIALLHADDESIEGSDAEEVFTFLREEILADLNSLFLVPASPSEPIRLMHTSIRDLLIDRRRCGERAYWVNLAENHQRLGAVSIRQMNRHLKENICGLSDISKSSSEVQDIVERELSKGIQYCCRSWAVHTTEGHSWSESRACSGVQKAEFESFSHEKVLFWLEVMSLLGLTSEAIVMAKQTYHLLLVRISVWTYTYSKKGTDQILVAMDPRNIWVQLTHHIVE